VRAYKFLRTDGTGAFSRFAWPLPGDGPGAWVETEPRPCRAGIHACRVSDLPYWAGRVLYEIELDGAIAEHATKVVAPRGRLLRRVEAWDEDLRARYTRYCADRAQQVARETGLERWEEVIEPSLPEGPALLSFVAARIADEAGGPDAYLAERARHGEWLAGALGLV
jgi:hypothetical protein